MLLTKNTKKKKDIQLINEKSQNCAEVRILRESSVHFYWNLLCYKYILKINLLTANTKHSNSHGFYNGAVCSRAFSLSYNSITVLPWPITLQNMFIQCVPLFSKPILTFNCCRDTCLIRHHFRIGPNHLT